MTHHNGQKRYNGNEGLAMLDKMPLGELMAMAHEVRSAKIPGNQVSFVYDTNPNYTNICVSSCAFCAFYRKPGDPKGYTLSPEALADKVKKASDQGATTVLLQGGHNPEIRLKNWIAYIKAIQEKCPGVHIHPFSPAEYFFMAQNEKIPLKRLLKEIFDLGIDTIPGGGAEILTENVRRQIANKKATAHQWLKVCEIAHETGFRTTATMMFGHVETNADIIEHLLCLRDLQDRTRGFYSFIPWSFKPGNSRLAKKVSQSAHPARYVRIIALARLLLDNFDHIQSSWFSESVPAGQLGLLAGADDFGGVLVEENVLQEAGHDRATTFENVLTIIRRAGFQPVLRDSHYKPIQTFPGPEPLGIGMI